MPRIPRDKRFDSTLTLFRDPYEFISKRCRRYGSDLFQTRLLLQKTICMTKPLASEVCYNLSPFIRRGNMRGRIQNTLLVRGGVQGLDDQAH